MNNDVKLLKGFIMTVIERLYEIEQELQKLEAETRDNEIANNYVYDAQNSVLSAISELEE